MANIKLKPNTARLRDDTEYLAENFTDKSTPGYTRRAFTPEYKEARIWLRNKMLEAGLETSFDSTANLIGRMKGNNPDLKPIVIGSHIDTVMCGGKFDGIIGVIAGLEIARLLRENNVKPDHSLEIIDFTSEEPSDFGISTIGSRGMVGNLFPDMLDRVDQENRKLSDLIDYIGGNSDKIQETARLPGDVALYLEIHIEQGPVLESKNKKIGVVTGIAGIQRFKFTVAGMQNHAGTIPMNLRKDALTGACEIVLALESLAQDYSRDKHLVATVGKFNIEPNSANIIPGKCTFEMEIRAQDSEIIDSLMGDFQHLVDKIVHERGIQVDFQRISISDAVIIGEYIQQVLFNTCSKIGETMYIQSGAGHDTNQMSKIAPVGMLFVPSKNGRSHCPEENSSYEDIALVVGGLINSLLEFDKILQNKINQ